MRSKLFLDCVHYVFSWKGLLDISKILLAGLFMCLTIHYAIATPSTLLQVDNCFNVSVQARLLDGNRSSFSFAGMKLVNNVWFVDCHNLGSFNVSFVPGSSVALPSSDWRTYEFNITYYQYIINSSSGKVVFRDFGDRGNVLGKDITSEVDNKIVVYEPVYQDRIIVRNVTVEKVVYVQNYSFIDRNITVSQPIYFENTSRIDELNKSLLNFSEMLNVKDSEIRMLSFWGMFSTILLVIILCFIVYWRLKK